MADNPDSPQDDGVVGLPKIDSAMNKRSPMDTAGGKGAKDDDKNTRLGRDKSKDADLLARARKRFERCVAYEADNRKAALDDLKFKAGEQWPPDVVTQRNLDNRPCLTINKMPTFVHQVTNDLRENRPGINVSPVGDKGDIEVAKMNRGLIRAIERDCHADIAYDTASDGAVSNGLGHVRILTEYESPTSFNQVIKIARIRNPFTVYRDPDHQEPDSSDCKFGFISEMIPRDEFKAQWPEADPVNWDLTGAGESMRNWVDRDNVRVAEYFEIESKKRMLVQLSNGYVGWEDDLSDEAQHMLDSGVVDIVNERESEEKKWKWYKLTVNEILEDKDWPGQWFPVASCIGDEIDIEGKVKYSGVIRNAKDAQRMYNYSATAEVELVALAPKAPFVVAEGQIEGYEQQWKQANTKSFPYLQYRPQSVDGKPAPPPQRQPMVTAPQGWEVIKQGASQDMMATTGVRFDPSQGNRIDESGIAQREFRRTGDLTSFHYADNMARMLRHVGAMLIDLIPVVYDTRRICMILREDGTEEQIQIDPNAPKPMTEGTHPATGKKMKIFNPTYGKYGVTVTIGPSYATKRIEAAENMMAFAKAMPGVAGMIADLIAKSMDWPGSEEIAARLAKVIAMQHPGLMTANIKDVPPQVQAVLQSMEAQIKQMVMERQQMLKALTDQQADRAQRQDKIDKDFEAKLMGIVQKAEQAFNKDIGQGLAKLADQVKQLEGQLAKPVEQPKPQGPSPEEAASQRDKDAFDRKIRLLEVAGKFMATRKKDAA